MKFLGKITPTVAAVAASLVMGGTASYAAGSLITSAQIKDGAVHSQDISAGAVTSGKIADHAVRLNDISLGAQDALQGNQGPKGDTGAQGPQGDQGPKGDTGNAGKDGVSGVQADTPYGDDIDHNDGLSQSADTIPAGATQSVWVECHGDSMTAISGGFIMGATGDWVAGGTYLPNVTVMSSVPAYVENGALSYNAPITDQGVGSFRPNAWAVSVHNGSDSDVVVRPSVVCAATQS